MTVIATLQLYNEQEPDGSPFDKEFKDEREMRDWLINQMGHPWLSYRLINKYIVTKED